MDGRAEQKKNMKKEEKLKLAKKLINEQIDKTNKRWKGDDLTTYTWGWRNEDTVSSDHNGQFFYMEKVRKIVNALELNYCLTVGPNCDGNMTPYITIY